MDNMARLQALNDAKERKGEEIRNLRHDFPDVLLRQKEKDRIEAEILEIQEEIEKITCLVQADAVAKEIKKYIAMFRDYAKANQEEVADVIRLLLNLVIFMRKNLEPELAEISKLGAQALFRDCKNLKDSGFKHGDAMSVVLARIAKSAGFTKFITDAASVVSKAETKLN